MTHKIRLFCLGLIISLIIVPGNLKGQDQTLSFGDPSDVGMDKDVLEAGISLFKKAVDNDQIRGGVILISRNGKIVLHREIGWKDKEKGIPMQKDAMFRMASNTKPVVATGISILNESKILNYSDYVRKHIDSFNNYRSGSIKIHHLLTHTSGFRIAPIFYRPLIGRSDENPDAPSLVLEVNRFGETGAEVEVGSSYAYSNAGFNTLGALIEIESGKPLEVFLKEKIYNPLGMKDTYHHEVAEKLDGKLDRMSKVYYMRDGQWTIGWTPGDSPQYPFVRASGGMISTTMDYAIFCQMFLNGGIYNGKRILTAETVKIMTESHTKSLYTPEEKEILSSYYGYGWAIRKDGSFGHSGSDGTYALIDPNTDLIILVFTQSPGPYSQDLVMRFIDIVNASIED